MRTRAYLEGEVVKFPLVPNFRFESIYTIDLAKLRCRGVTLLLADLDNTIVPYTVMMPDERVRQWRSDLAEQGIALFILSNNRKPGRAQRFAEVLGVPYQGHAGKPRRKGFRMAMARMHRTPEQTAIVGDQIFTDIWGGSNAGILSLLVKPIAFGNAFRALRYAVETPFRLCGKRGENL